MRTNSSILLETLKKLEEKHDCPQFASMIAREAKVNFNSARRDFRRLLKEKKVFQRYLRGPYSLRQMNVPGDGAAGHIQAYPLCLPRVQNVNFRVGAAVSRGLPEDDYDVGCVHFHIWYGRKYQRVSGRLSCDVGLGLQELRFAFREVQRRVCDMLGCHLDVGDFEVTDFELFKDYFDVRLQFAKCMTVRNFLGQLEKIYEKTDRVRHEFKVQGSFPLATFYSLVQGGPAVSSVMAANYAILQEMRETNSYYQRLQESTQFLVSTMKAVYDAAQRARAPMFPRPPELYPGFRYYESLARARSTPMTKAEKVLQKEGYVED